MVAVVMAITGKQCAQSFNIKCNNLYQHASWLYVYNSYKTVLKHAIIVRVLLNIALQALHFV